MIEFISQINQTCSDRELTQKALSAAVILNCVTNSTLPNGEVEDPFDYYQGAHVLRNDSFISAVNEHYLIDTEYVRQRVRDLWIARYRTAYPRSQLDVILSLSGGSALSEVEKTFFTENDHLISRMVEILDKHFRQE